MRTNVINFIRYGEFLNIGTLITDCGQNKSLLITHIPDDCRNGFSFEADTLTIRNRNVIGQSIEDTISQSLAFRDQKLLSLLQSKMDCKLKISISNYVIIQKWVPFLFDVFVYN